MYSALIAALTAINLQPYSTLFSNCQSLKFSVMHRMTYVKQQRVLYLKLDRPREPRKPPRLPPDDLLKCDANSTWSTLPWKVCHNHITMVFTNNCRQRWILKHSSQAEIYLHNVATLKKTNLAIHGTACFIAISTAGECDKCKSTRNICLTIFRNMNWNRHSRMQCIKHFISYTKTHMQHDVNVMLSLQLWPSKLMLQDTDRGNLGKC